MLFSDLCALCDTIDFDPVARVELTKGNHDKVWAELIEENPDIPDFNLCPETYELSFAYKGLPFRGQTIDIIVESCEFSHETQLEVVEGFTQLEDGTWDLTSGVLLLDNGNECSEKVIVSTPIEDEDNFIIYYPDDEGFDFIQGSVMFQTLDELGEKEWTCFYVCDGTPWTIVLPHYDPTL